MASPQKENGYTAIANELMEALTKIRIPGEAMQVLLCIFRKTYGFNKSEDKISLSQFVLSTGLKRSNVCRGIEKLVEMNLIIRNDTTLIIKYRINKDFSTWKPLSKQIPRGRALSETITPIIQSDNSLVSEAIHTKVDITKDTITKEIRSEAQIFNSELFKYHKELTGLDFKDTPYDRMRYPRLIRNKFPNIDDVKQAIYRAWNQRKKDGFYYWRDGRLTLAKLYHRLIQESIDEKKSQDQSQRFYDLKKNIGIKTI